MHTKTLYLSLVTASVCLRFDKILALFDVFDPNLLTSMAAGGPCSQPRKAGDVDVKMIHASHSTVYSQICQLHPPFSNAKTMSSLTSRNATISIIMSSKSHEICQTIYESKYLICRDANTQKTDFYFYYL